MNMRRTTRIALAAGLIAVVAGPGARANDVGGGCGTDPAKPATYWRGSASCPFLFRGVPLIVRGTASASGTASIHVWISIVPNGPALIECSRSSAGTTSCATNLPDGSTNVQNGLLHTTVYCNVQGTSTGTFWCQSALGF